MLLLIVAMLSKVQQSLINFDLILQTVRCKHKIRSVAISPHGPKDGVLVTLALVNNCLEVCNVSCIIPVLV